MKTKTLCATCQHLGDAAFPSVRYYIDGKWESKLMGFSDRLNGEPVDNPARRCNHPKMARTLVYEKLEHPMPCQYWEERKWVRPETCGECKFRTVYTDGTFRCAGHPFCGEHNRDEEACINGQVDINSQLTLF